ncbi:MAG: GxxExxY protein [bacterium]|nr:GxxExxY protein [bacterium]
MSKLRNENIIYPELSYKIIGNAFEVFNELGSGHHEKYYERALIESFKKNQLQFQSQVPFVVKFQGKVIGRNYLDFLVDNKIIVELKKDNKFSKKHIDQVLEYLKITRLKLAILINFTRQGVVSKRIINFDIS